MELAGATDRGPESFSSNLVNFFSGLPVSVSTADSFGDIQDLTRAVSETRISFPPLGTAQELLSLACEFGKILELNSVQRDIGSRLCWTGTESERPSFGSVSPGQAHALTPLRFLGEGIPKAQKPAKKRRLSIVPLYETFEKALQA
jgi:hypothetical protein